MNPWVDAVVRIGLPTVLLGVVLWKLWPVFIKFIDRMEERLAKYDKALEVSRKDLAESNLEKVQMAAQWAAILEKSNENNAELARQLGRNNEIQAYKAREKAMNLGPWLFIFYTLSFYTVGCLAWVCGRWYMMNRFYNGEAHIMRVQGWQLYALAYFFLSDLVAHAFGFKQKPVYTIGFAIAYWQGMVVLALSLVWLNGLQAKLDKRKRSPVLLVFIVWVIEQIQKRKKKAAPER